MDDLIKALDKLLGKELSDAERKQHHDLILQEILRKISTLAEGSEKDRMTEILHFISHHKYQDAKALLQKQTKSIPWVPLLIILLLLLVLGFLWYTGRLQLF